MKSLRRLFSRNTHPRSGRFERYYSEILRSGSGYPTADEARRDLNNYDRTSMRLGWPH